MAVLLDGCTAIGRVRVRGRTRDALATRRRVERFLGQGGDLSDAVPATAILCIRQLTGTLPPEATWDSHAAPSAWHRAVRDRLVVLAAGAVRPAQDPAAAAADAVLFADRAELLACLARDWAAGALARWWWPLLVGHGAGLDLVVRTWLGDPSQVAAALERTASLGALPGFVRRLPVSAARALLHAVVTVHDLHRLGSLAIHQTGDAGVDAPASRDAARAAASPIREFMAAPPPAAPWRAWAPEAAAPGLRPDQQLLIGVALTLYRRAIVARSASFALEVERWRAAPSRVPAHDAAGELDRREERRRVVANEPVERDVAGPPTAAASGLRLGGDAPGDRELCGGDLPLVPHDRPGAMRRATRADVVTATPAPPLQRVWQVFDDGVSVSTGYAGIFYLLNVALALDLYGDFTKPAARGLELSIWDFVALVARALLGGSLERDPVWALLASLAGRSHREPPGAGFEAPPEWRIPDGWLDAFPERDGWTWSATRGRLRIVHAAGFPVADVPCPVPRAATQVSPMLARYGVSASRTAAVSSVDSDPLARWVHWTATYVRARLGRALAVPVPAAAAVACRTVGRAVVTSTQVEIVMALPDLPLPVRLAGLDRDPGWIPAADRRVVFRFE